MQSENNKERLTIIEFAEAVGVSRQTIYRQLDKRLSEYVEEVDGKKYINGSAVEVWKLQGEKSKPHDKQKSKPEGKQANEGEDTERLLKAKQELIESLKEELEENKKTITDLRETNKGLLDLIKTNQKLLENNQAVVMTQAMALGSPEADDPEEEPEEEQPKKGILYKLGLRK